MFGRRRNYRIDRRVLENPDASLPWDVIEPVWRLKRADVDEAELPKVWRNATDGQLAVYAVTWVEREVLNGGFEQYFYNTWADLPLRALEGFRRLGMSGYAALLERALSVFHNGFPPTRLERVALIDEGLADADQELLDAFDSQFYDLYGEDGASFYDPIEAYIRANTDEFFR